MVMSASDGESMFPASRRDVWGRQADYFLLSASAEGKGRLLIYAQAFGALLPDLAYALNHRETRPTDALRLCPPPSWTVDRRIGRREAIIIHHWNATCSGPLAWPKPLALAKCNSKRMPGGLVLESFDLTYIGNEPR
jgi:hypothetical protein